MRTRRAVNDQLLWTKTRCLANGPNEEYVLYYCLTKCVLNRAAILLVSYFKETCGAS